VLIVDDEPFNLIALEGLLQMHNVGKVDKAYYGDEALRMVENNGRCGPLRGKNLSSKCGKNH
jgi:YesN/AraC family two-component response regulator